MKTLIFGSKGYLGSRLLKDDPNCVGTSLRITANSRYLGELLDHEQPDAVINCIGKTGRPNIDWCEDHKEETEFVNIAVPTILSAACELRGIHFTHISSGCMYSGEGPYKGSTEGFAEHMPPNYGGSFYSRTKAAAESVLLRNHDALILRPRMPIDNVGHSRNTICKLVRYSHVLHAYQSMTYVPDFIAATKRLIEMRRTGVYNVVNPGVMSPWEIVTRWRDAHPMQIPAYQKINESELAEVCKTGRSVCTLSCMKLLREGIYMRPIEIAVDEAIEDLLST